jgi:hypothetical protein
MEDFDNNEKYAKYKQFAVGDEKSVYKLTIGGYQGDAGEAYNFRCISEQCRLGLILGMGITIMKALKLKVISR